MCKKELNSPEEILNHTCHKTQRQTTFAGDSEKEVPTSAEQKVTYEKLEAIMDKAFDIKDTLDQRRQEYGKFETLSVIAQGMKFYLRCCDKWQELTADQQEALDMIASKISRILNGNPNNVDSWHDIAGYATLIADRLRGNSR
jgi:hypothetical protein